MAADAYAMEAMTTITAAFIDRGLEDYMLETAMLKVWSTEAMWLMVNDTLQIYGGAGYFNDQPLERMMRDARINLIFEGSSEIMRLFIAREAVDAHFSIAFPIVAPESSLSTRLKAAMKAAPFYLTWYPARWIPSFKSFGEFGRLATHMRFVDRTTRKLGRSLFHAMVRFGPKLERKQMVLFRAVDIGAELFAMAASCARAQMLAKVHNQPQAVQLADAFCVEARERIAQLFRSLYGPHDPELYKLAMSVMNGEHTWLEDGIVDENSFMNMPAKPAASSARREAAGVA
jgi:alkylation response protein AidB-like acyl-CoA dehydrogenase